MSSITIRTTARYTTLNLGRALENNASDISFDFSQWVSLYGDGEITLFHKRATDSEAYPVTLIKDGNIAKWNITSTDTSFAGTGQAQLTYKVDGIVKKSIIYKTEVLPSIVSTTEIPPDPYESWLETLDGIASDAIQSALSASQSEANALAYKNASEAAQRNASQSESSASESAIVAQGHAQTAKTYSESAQGFAGNAQTHASNAQSYANQASGYANDAQGYAQQAEGAVRDTISFTEEDEGKVVITWR